MNKIKHGVESIGDESNLDMVFRQGLSEEGTFKIRMTRND